jgi:methionyl-tRNA formyltransferase
MRMEAGLDTGNMLLRHSIPILDQDTGGSLHDRLAELGASSILDYLDQAETIGPGEIQDSSASCYAKKLSKQEAEIDWSQPADWIARTIRAFNPWPGACTTSRNERVRLLAAQALPDRTTAEPCGTIVHRQREGIDVACKDGQLRILQLQLPGGKAITAADLINGKQTLLQEGECLTATEA